MPRPNTHGANMDYWWQHAVSVERWKGPGAYGDEYDAPVLVTGLYVDKERLVVNGAGSQIIAAGTFYYPAGVAFIPLQSHLTLPTIFGARVVSVVSTTVDDFGALPFVAYQEAGVR